jgi:hypothetical protein
MNYLIGTILIALVTTLFLLLLSKFQSGVWPSKNVSNFAGALWELVTGYRRIS